MNAPDNEDRKDLIITHTFNARHAQIMAAWSEPKLPQALHSEVILTFAEDGPTTCVVLKYQDISMISEEACVSLQDVWEECFAQIESRLKQGATMGHSPQGTAERGDSETPCTDVDNMGRLPRCEL